MTSKRNSILLYFFVSLVMINRETNCELAENNDLSLCEKSNPTMIRLALALV